MAAFAHPLEADAAGAGAAVPVPAVELFEDNGGSGGSTTSAAVSGGAGASAGGSDPGSANPINEPASAGSIVYATVVAFKSEQGLPASVWFIYEEWMNEWYQA